MRQLRTRQKEFIKPSVRNRDKIKKAVYMEHQHESG